MIKKLIAASVISLLGIGAGILLTQKYETKVKIISPESSFSRKTPMSSKQKSQLSDSIFVDYPQPNDVVSSPLKIRGRAKGTWFFEASAPVKLLDAEGEDHAQGFIQAIGDWMTEDYVDFSGEIVFDPDGETKGTLVLSNDNPSGLPENNLQLSIPVLISN